MKKLRILQSGREKIVKICKFFFNLEFEKKNCFKNVFKIVQKMSENFPTKQKNKTCQMIAITGEEKIPQHTKMYGFL